MKNQQTNIIKVLVLIIFFLSLIGILGSIERFAEGIHSIDVGRNMGYVNCLTGLEFVDIGSDFQARTEMEVFILGMNQTKEAFGMLFFFSLFLGLSLCAIIRGYLR